ncbi:MAG: hypothetical protein EOR45_33340 [Mesorhizobium sp.]|nr:MAG: hypothetical protein EOR45_33340 [Mesorhizobium sp.]
MDEIAKGGGLHRRELSCEDPIQPSWSWGWRLHIGPAFAPDEAAMGVALVEAANGTGRALTSTYAHF